MQRRKSGISFKSEPTNKIYIKLDEVTNFLVVINLNRVIEHPLKSAPTSLPLDNSLSSSAPWILDMAIVSFWLLLHPGTGWGL